MIGPLPQHRGVHGEDLFPTVHLDRGYDSGKTRDLLDILGLRRRDRPQGRPGPDPGRAPVAGGAHPLLDERLRQAAPLHRQRKVIVDFYLFLAAALTVIRRLINRARTRYRWPTRPTTRRLR